MSPQHAEDDAAGGRAQPRLTLEEALQRYRIEEDVTEDLARSGWQDDAMRDVIGSMED